MIDPKRAKQLFGARQRDWFRLAAARHDLTILRLHALTGISKTTLATWATGRTAMPAWGQWELAQHIPDDLTCMLVERSGKYVGTCEPGEGSFDTLAREASGFTSAYLEARDPAGPGGINIVPMERARLQERARKVACSGRAAAA